MLLLPSRGVNVFVNFDFEDAAVFRVVGAFTEGEYITRIHWSWTSVDVATIILAATLGGSNSETIEGLTAGADLLDRSDLGFLTGSKVRSYRFGVIAGGVGSFVQAVGRRIEIGSNFVTFGFGMTGSADVSVSAAVEVVRLVKNAGG